MASRALACLALLASLAGCSSAPNAYDKASRYPLIAATYGATDQLREQMHKAVAVPGPLVVATLVDINDLEKSSAFGRTIAEQVSAGFTRNGFQIIEMKYRNAVYIKRSQGELVLSREIRDLATSNNARGVVAGTYSVGNDLVFVNLKVIRQEENLVLASQDFALPLDANIRSLLRNQ